MTFMGIWLLGSLVFSAWWCLAMRRRESVSEPRMRNVLDYGAVDESECVPEGLGQSRRVDPGPVTWVELPSNPELWIYAVAMKSVAR